ncbi:MULTISPECIES: hypothetical protein [unclassified Streptomyces]|uniref:hypothetical protein n=1 Tax=Streptomyces TaxID=1883 RepID=UPI001367D4B4|nr:MULTISPECIES: hypothetical protein [unclassified Streptomyces]NEA04885.1 hypothetical protein [Streptomyces sp. SID10116]MYY87539.1 hypothetical protein [Streptomyces sp. SID335]MYZ13354.1 hypothetical protein [Streptomyces sp. SID337]NDZ91458.1 hypothetical protein [Streptomyces sp. SID10115]NEB49750.1 hypothetical protein [Streptomyces sp. SID339]
MSSQNRTRTVLLTVLSIVLLVLVSGAASIWFHRDQESDRRARVDQQRPSPTAPLPDPFVTGPPR